MSKKMNSKKKGLTLLEVVVALAVISLIAAVGVPLYQSVQTRNDLSVATDIVGRSLRRAQGLSQMNHEERWGVAIREGEVIIFKGSNFGGRDEEYDEALKISKGIAITGGTEIVFSYTGAPSFTGDIELSAPNGEVRTVIINSAGAISMAVADKGDDSEDEGGETLLTPYDIAITYDWTEAYCANVNITTESEEPILWEVNILLDTFPLNGTPYEVWNAQWSFENNTLQATGDGWNELVSASTPRSFGFCSQRDFEEQQPGDPGDPSGTIDYDVNITSDWGSGYCANVDITTESEQPILWEVDILLDTAPLNGTPYNVWNAQWSFENNTLQATGDGWNELVSASTPRNFGFCANR